MSRGPRTPRPSRRNVEGLLDAARSKGVQVVTITTADGAAYKFNFNAEAEVPVAEAADPIGDRIRNWNPKDETKPKSKVR